MNVSGWWIHYNNITIGSARNTLYLNLSFSMVMHCVESSYFFLLVLSDADKSGGEKSRSKIMILIALFELTVIARRQGAVAGCVCVRHTETETKRETERERMWNWARVKGDGSKIIMKAFKSWGKVSVRLFRNSCNIQIYLYSLCRDCLLQQRVANGKLLFAAPNGLSIWKWSLASHAFLLCFQPCHDSPFPTPLPHHSPCDCLSLSGNSQI